MIQGLVIGLVVAIAAVLGTSQPSHALHAVDSLTRPLLGRAQQAEERVQSVNDRRAERQTELDAKRQAIEQRIAERRAAITEKLTGERAERCEKKEATINRMLDARVSTAQKHFDKLKSIHDKLTAFAVQEELAVDNANALELILNEKQSDAQITIDAVNALDFECADTDANAPGAIVTDQVTETKQALKDYRTAIKDYAVAVRSAATGNAAENPTTSVQGESSERGTDESVENQEVVQ